MSDLLEQLLPPSLLSILPKSDLALYTLVAALAIIPIPLAYVFFLLRPSTRTTTQKGRKNVLIIGASSGIGKGIALEYARRGDWVCVTGRREGELEEVREECARVRKEMKMKRGQNGRVEELEEVLAVKGDFTKADDMVALREHIEKTWSRLDTVVIAAGVSALKPIMSVAGCDNPRRNTTTVQGIQHAKDVAVRAMEGNYLGPLVTAVTFIPLLSKSSPNPSVILISSAASLIPAPTRTLYGSTKSAALQLFQSLSIENPQVKFTNILPFTVEGDFRKSAVDGGDVRESLKGALKVEDVARQSVRAGDEGRKRMWIPWWGGWAYALWLVWPQFVEDKARKKYGFKAQ